MGLIAHDSYPFMRFYSSFYFMKKRKTVNKIRIDNLGGSEVVKIRQYFQKCHSTFLGP